MFWLRPGLWPSSLPCFLSPQSSACNARWGGGKGSFYFPSARLMISISKMLPEMCLCCHSTITLLHVHWFVFIFLGNPENQDGEIQNGVKVNGRRWCENEKMAVLLRQQWMLSEWFDYQKSGQSQLFSLKNFTVLFLFWGDCVKL